MAKIKRFLFYHGEKVVFALVALLSVWSIFGNLLRKSNELPLSSGDIYVVENDRVKSSVKRIKKHFASNKVINVPPPIQEVSRLIDIQYREYARKTASASLQWVMYNQPPKPESVTVVVIPPPPGEDPEDHWRTAVGAPIEWRIIVGRERNLIICRTRGEQEGGVRFPKPGSVNVSIWSKRVGEGREDLRDEIRNAFRQRQAEGLNPLISMDLAVRREVEREEPKPEPEREARDAPNPFDDFIPGDNPEMLDPRNRRRRRKKTRKPTRTTRSRRTSRLPWMRDQGIQPPGFEDGMPGFEEGAGPEDRREEAEPTNVREAYYRQLQRVENETWRNMYKLADRTTLMPSKWELKAGKMAVYSENDFEELFTEKAVKKILAEGKLPLPGKTRPDSLRKPASAVPAKGPDVPVAPGPAPGPAPVPVPDPVPDPGAGNGGPTMPRIPASALKDKYPDYEPQYFVFLDNDVDENTVYRYRMVTWLKARDLPEEIKNIDVYKDYNLRVENADLTWKVNLNGKEQVEGFFAVTASQFNDSLKAEKPVKFIGGKYQPGNYRPIRRDSKNRVMDLQDALGNQTKLGFEMANKPCFSLFTYTDVVLTPILRRIHLVGTSYSKDGIATVRVHVYLSTQDGYKRTPVSFPVTEPVEANSLTWRHWVVLGSDKKPLWKDGKPVLKSIAEYYAKIRPVPIGGKQKIGNKEWDFSTGWGLVDVNRCKLRVYRYRIVEDEKPQLVGGKPVIKDGGPYVVLRSLNKKKLYRRVLQRRIEPMMSDKIQEKIEIIWRPQLQEWITRKLEARKNAAAKAPQQKSKSNGTPEETNKAGNVDNGK